MIGPCAALAATHYFLGNFETCGQYAIRGVQIWRSVGVQSSVEEVDVPEVGCLIFEALFKWHIGEIAPSQVTIEEALSLAKGLNDMHGLAVAVHYAVILASVFPVTPGKASHGLRTIGQSVTCILSHLPWH